MNTWCPHCKGRCKLSIDDAHRIAADRSGKMLSSEYLNASCKLLWQCEHGHQWQASMNNIKNKSSWCSHCHWGRRKLSIDDAHRAAANRDGNMLSSEYVNVGSKLLSQCVHGHQWKTSLNNVKNRNTWCPRCSRTTRKASIDGARVD